MTPELRELCVYLRSRLDFKPGHFKQAADAIESLAQQLAEARRDNTDYAQAYSQVVIERDQLRSDRRALAERVRLACHDATYVRVGGLEGARVFIAAIDLDALLNEEPKSK